MMVVMKAVLAFSAVLLCARLTQCAPARQALNQRPIIGIMTQTTDPSKSSPGDLYLPSSYVKYLEMAGARVVPILVRQPFSYYTEMFNSINGVLFPGGGVDILKSEFSKASKVFYDLAIEANDNGDYFPVWGTCQGFEVLTALTTGVDLMSNYSAHDYPIPLIFHDGYNESKMFGNLPDDVYSYLSTQDVTENFHQFGLAPETYENTPALKAFYKVLSTNYDRNGKEFVSTIEARDYPIYGVQWHPEKPVFTWSLSYDINHGQAAVRVAQHMANFLVSEARKSFHHFYDLNAELNSLINNYRPQFFKTTHFTENYYFNFTSNASDSLRFESELRLKMANGNI